MRSLGKHIEPPVESQEGGREDSQVAARSSARFARGPQDEAGPPLQALDSQRGQGEVEEDPR